MIITIVILFSPAFSFASTVHFDSDNAHPTIGDTVTITVKLDTEGKQINLVEGNINLNTYDHSYEIKEITSDDSVLSLWANKPLFSKEGDVISFTGGEPGGFNSRSASLFKIVLSIKKEGTLVMSPQNITAYINDGKGTVDTVIGETKTIKIHSSETFFYSNDVLMLSILLLSVVLYGVVTFFLKNKK